MRTRLLFFPCAAAAFLGCVGELGEERLAEPGLMTLHEIAWNPKQAEVGKVAAVAEVGNMLAVFSDIGATMLVAGVVEANDPSVIAWKTATTIPAADGSGIWAAAVDAKGRVIRVRDQNRLDDISDRYGLTDVPVQSLSAVGGPVVGFGLEAGLAVADGHDVATYTLKGVSPVAGASGHVVWIAQDGDVQILEASTGKLEALVVPSVGATVIDASGRIIVTTPHEVYTRATDGSAQRLFNAGSRTVHGLAAAGNRVWFGLDTDLCMLEGESLSCTNSGSFPADSRLQGSETGDVWVIAQGKLQRFAPEASGDEGIWRATVLPIYARVCAQCHNQDNPTSGIVLASYEAWSTRRKAIQQRVIVKGDMPPVGSLPVADKERKMIGDWASAPAP